MTNARITPAGKANSAVEGKPCTVKSLWLYHKTARVRLINCADPHTARGIAQGRHDQRGEHRLNLDSGGWYSLRKWTHPPRRSGPTLRRRASRVEPAGVSPGAMVGQDLRPLHPARSTHALW